MNLRALAARALIQTLYQPTPRSINDAFAAALVGLSPKDQALLKELCFGVCRWRTLLEYRFTECLEKPLRAKDKDVLVLGALGLYQLQYLNIPSHAAINETAGAARELKKPWAVKLLNAVLRKLSEVESDNVVLPPSWDIRHAHPDWMIHRLKSDWKPLVETILKNNNIPAPMCLRVNQKQRSRGDYARDLQSLENALSSREGELSNMALYLDQAVPVQALPNFQQGMCSVQDEAAQLAAQVLNPSSGQRVLDACAAPGGKSAHLLEVADIRLTCIDISDTRNQRVKENLDRARLNAEVLTADVGDIDSWWDGECFDQILLDAPCSATGVIRRHPDIKWLRREDDISTLISTQAALLDALWPLLKPGGCLLYATCSIFKSENEEQIASFLKRHSDVRDVSAESLLGHIDDDDFSQKRPFGRQFFPKPDAHDGFYYAKLRKQR